MNYTLGKTSKKRLSTCHKTWRKVINLAIQTSPLDFGVVCGGRGKQAQETAYLSGKSLAKWGESDHNFRLGNKLCSLAIDLGPYCHVSRDYVWNDEHAWKVLADHIISCGKRFGHKIEWGGNWKTIIDKPHFVLRF